MRAAIINAQNKVVNVIIVNSLADIPDCVAGETAKIGDIYNPANGTFTTPAYVPPVPASCSRRQGKEAMIRTLKNSTPILDLVLAAVAAIPDATQKRLAENYIHESNEYERAHPNVQGIGALAGLTSSEIDDLFRLAVTL